MYFELSEFEQRVEFENRWVYSASRSTETLAIEFVNKMKEINKGRDVIYTCCTCDKENVYKNIMWKFAYKTKKERNEILRILDVHAKSDMPNIIESVKCPFINEV